eukprot:14979654-Alexandrium_andersonii.AAC.1
MGVPFGSALGGACNQHLTRKAFDMLLRRCGALVSAAACSTACSGSSTRSTGAAAQQWQQQRTT